MKAGLQFNFLMLFSVCMWISIAVTKHYVQKQVGNEMGYLAYTSMTRLFITRSQRGTQRGRDPGGGTVAEAMEECCLLICSSWLPQSAFLKNPGP